MSNYILKDGRILRKVEEVVSNHAPITGLGHLAEDLPSLHELIGRLIQENVRFKLESPGSRKRLDRWRLLVFTEKGEVVVEAHSKSWLSKAFAAELDGVEAASLNTTDFVNKEASESETRTIEEIVSDARSDVYLTGT